MLEINNLSKTYIKDNERITPFRGLTLSVPRGEFVGLVGPSGCGKSTLLLIAGGLLQPTEGTVMVAGNDLYRMSSDARAQFRAANIGFVFQQFHLIPYLTVLDNVLASGIASPVDQAKSRAGELLERFGLAHRASHYPAELSTGERQRTALARALLHRPKLLLADEPTGNLDEENGRIVLNHLAELAKDGAAVLLVTHDHRAADFTTRMMPLYETKELKVETAT